MKIEDIKVIKDCLIKYGDDFWTEEIEQEMSDGIITSNTELIYDIISCLNKAGYDLELIKKI